MARLNDHVLLDLPLRQWVLAVPKRLRHFLERDGRDRGLEAVDGSALKMSLARSGETSRGNAPAPTRTPM